MKKVDRWLLPDGIEEMLPQEASKTEALRRRLLDTYQSWGYDNVIPPMVEFTDSLLTGSGKDVDLLTFKVTDQVSGKTMGIRADITPQAARMDAHSLQREGVNRLCYTGHVMHAKEKAPLASRTPIQAGVELFGESGLDADIEVISLLIESLTAAGLAKQYIDIGHVGIYRALCEFAEFDDRQERALFGILQSKSITDLTLWLKDNVQDKQMRDWFFALPQLSGEASTLEKARAVFADAPAEIAVALDELSAINAVIARRFPSAQLYFDLSELRGYHYLTGVVFGAYVPGVGYAVASGGRYDHVGASFGRARSATGFAINVTALGRALEQPFVPDKGIFVPSIEELDQDDELWHKIRHLRQQGLRVVQGFSTQISPLDYQYCDRVLVKKNDAWVVVDLT